MCEFSIYAFSYSQGTLQGKGDLSCCRNSTLNHMGLQSLYFDIATQSMNLANHPAFVF